MWLRYWFYCFTRASLREKIKTLGCFFGRHEGVYGIVGESLYEVRCFHCNKLLDKGNEFCPSDDRECCRDICDENCPHYWE